AVAVGAGVGTCDGHPVKANARMPTIRRIAGAFPNRPQTGKRIPMNTDELIQPDRGQDAIPIHLVNKDGFEAFAKGLSTGQRAALAAQKFTGGGFQVGIVPDGDGWYAVGGVADPAELSSWCLAKLAEELPAGTYRLASGV